MPDIFAKRLEDLPLKTQQVVSDLRNGLVELFAADLVAVWLYGGALFSPSAVDIDLHIVLRRPPNSNEGERIRQLHDKVSSNSPFIDELDPWYILLDDAGRAEPPPGVGPWHPGSVDEHWALHRAHWLAGACIVVHGLAPAEVVTEPGWPELVKTLRKEALDPEAATANSPYWTLQLCRILASLETRDVVRSKLDSADWALERLPAGAYAAIQLSGDAYDAGVAAGYRIHEDVYQDFYETIRPEIDAVLRANDV